MQTKIQSLIETLVGTGIGFCIALAAQFFITWWYDIEVSAAKNVWITVFFTGISILRGYAVRRFFNWIFSGRFK